MSDGYRNARVHRFTADGELKQSWGQPGKAAPGEFHLPHSLLVDGDGTVFVCDRENHRIQVFDADGEFQTIWTDIQRPMDISEGPDGNLYVSEGNRDDSPSRFSVLDKQGNVLSRFPARGGHGSWVDAHGDIYVGTQTSVDKYVRQR